MTLYTAVLQMVRMRHRQLGAHEVGHTLGLAHNFMGSVACAGSNADRATGRGGSCIESVMDYPGPMVRRRLFSPAAAQPSPAGLTGRPIAPPPGVLSRLGRPGRGDRRGAPRCGGL